jgi:hypothetical protein
VKTAGMKKENRRDKYSFYEEYPLRRGSSTIRHS